MIKILLKYCGLVLVLFAGWVFGMYMAQGKFVYFPPDYTRVDMSSLKDFETIQVRTEDGLDLHGFYRAPREGKPVLLYFHGNAGHSAWNAWNFEKLIANGYGIVMAEYRGYNGNPGVPNEQGLYKDGAAYLQWIAGNETLKNSPVILYGQSLGSGVAVEMAVRDRDAKGLILEVPFSSMGDLAELYYSYIPFVRHLVSNKFDNDSKIAQVKAPVLFIIAGRDEIVTKESGEKLAALANEPKDIHILPEAYHRDAYKNGADAIVLSFLKGRVR